MVILELEMKVVGLICRALRCPRLSRRLQLSFRRACLPLLALTRTPGGGHLEWMSACCDPFLEYCERSVWIVGMFCFFLVLIGISTVVYTFYVYMVPFMYATYSRPVFIFYFILGHYLLVNICFHYFKGVYTNPGCAPVIPDFQPDERQMKLGWKLCRKCDGPKPPRAHHCRICNRCVLKMDHHCPWMFNCIGQNNHRHFMSFVFFMLLGVMFVVNCTWSRAYDALSLDKSFMSGVINTIGLRGSVEMAKKMPVDYHTNETWLVVLVFFVGFGVTVALTMLGGWNAFLISRAETAIEFYTNQRDAKECRRLGKKYVNPYNHGFKKNWMLFLGFTSLKSFILRVVVPSGHRPLEDGIEWRRCDNLENRNGFPRTSDV